MKEETQRWIKAGTLIANNPECLVKCPECQKEFLEIEDIRADNNPELLERHMKCPSCGARNVLRLRRSVKEGG
jgi:DNA-directed RNA polymerase subunit RPC12/RpoP